MNAGPADDNAAATLTDREYYEGMCQFGQQLEAVTREMWEKDFLGKDTVSIPATDKKKERVSV